MFHVSDAARGMLWAIAILVVNVAISILVVACYAHLINPGHDAAYYDESAGHIAPWSSVVFGIPLFFGVAYWRGRAKPERNAKYFAIAICGWYTIIDVSIMAAGGAIASMTGILLLSLGTKWVAALAGAALLRREPKARR